MTRAPRLIVVDDEPELRKILSDYLGRHGFAVRAVAGAPELDACLTTEEADLLILDIAMPGEDGLSIARRIRSRSAVPILMLTAATDIVDRVVGLEVGADDYVVKPFDLRELRARVRALLRRSEILASPASLPPQENTAKLIQFGPVMLDMDGHQLLQDDGAVIALTSMEFDLLNAFAENPNRVLTRDRLLDLAHHRGSEPFDRSIDIRIARLRRKIEPDPSKPQVIKTIHGSGYMFVSPK
jgi:two-component system, OmpR family, response regulator